MIRIPSWTRPLMALAICSIAIEAQAQPSTGVMDSVMEVARSAGIHGEIALADVDGKIFDRTLGLADRERRQKHRVGARWLWASVTKQVTAILVMQQVEAGKLSLDGTIRTYLPDFVGAAGSVTLRQLLQHQSGLSNPDDTPTNVQGVPAFYRERGPGISNTERARGFCAVPAKSAHGQVFSYNNCDYLVLGAILERVTGQSFASLVTERIARPLGMRSIRVAADGERRGAAAAVGYQTGSKRYPDINVATFGAAGALTGTARDLITLDRALLKGKLVTAAGRRTLWEGDPKLGFQALGAWSFPARLRGCAKPLKLIERRGDVGGTQVRNVIAPEIGRSMAVFTNDDTVDFGEVWQGKGVSFDLLSAAFCSNGQPS